MRKIRFERVNDYVYDGDVTFTYYDHEDGILIGAQIEKTKDNKWMYFEYDDHVTGGNEKYFKNRKEALKYLLKRKKKLKEEAVNEWIEKFAD